MQRLRQVSDSSTGGTHQARLCGLPPAGKRVGVHVVRSADLARLDGRAARKT